MVLVGFACQIPSFVLAPIGGLITDRYNRHRLLVITQVLAMIQSLALAILTLTGTINISLLLGLGFFQGLINVVDYPVRQAFVYDMIERPEDRMNAIALNSSISTGAQLIGPAIAGIIIARVGAGYCFLLDGFSYIAVIVGLLLMHLKPQPLVLNSMRPIQRIQEGFNYAFHSLPIRSILMMISLFSLMVVASSTLMPIFATQILHGDAHTLGLLLTASGIGALIGGLYMNTRSTVLGLGKVFAYAPILCGVGLIIFALSPTIWLSIPAIMLVGLGSILHLSVGNTILQTIVEDDKRGRIMSLFTMSFLGVSPFGSLLAGSLANAIGAPGTLIISGLVCVISGFLFVKQLPKLRLIVRPIYLAKKILPAVPL